MNESLIDPEQLKIEKIEFCKKLKQKRLDLNYTQEYMASLLDMSLRTYQKIEKNGEFVNFERIAFLMKFLNNN
jgi:transcriptional regulator with XRE-family HTH domain